MPRSRSVFVQSAVRAIRAHIILIVALPVTCALIGMFYEQTLRDLFTLWDQPEYGHCYLLPVVALIWGWARWHQEKPVCRAHFVAGPAIILLAAFMASFGSLAANNWINHYSLVVMIAGVIVMLGGFGLFRAVLPAWFLLSFAVPFPPIMLAGMTAQMQLMSSTLSVMGLHLLGIPVFQEGNIIDLGSYKLQVAEACSGLRYVFPFMSFGYLFAFFFEKSWIRRSMLFAATLPIAIGMNALRIVIVGLTVDHWGQTMAEGVLHEFEGWVVFVGCLALLYVLSVVMNLVKRRTVLPALPAFRKTTIPNTPLHSIAAAFLLIALLGLCVAGERKFVSGQTEILPMRKNFADFPLRLGEWKGHSDTLKADDLATLRLSDYWLADYQSGEGTAPVNFYIAYYATQRREAAPHSPLVCIPGSGWEIASLVAPYAVRDAQGNVLLNVNRAIIRNGDTSQLVYFWFSERGRSVTSALDRKWFLFSDALTRHRTDGALLRVAIPIDRNSNDIATDRILSSFLAQALPELSPYLPD